MNPQLWVRATLYLLPLAASYLVVSLPSSLVAAGAVLSLHPAAYTNSFCLSMIFTEKLRKSFGKLLKLLNICFLVFFALCLALRAPPTTEGG
jgi:hypothetical protein